MSLYTTEVRYICEQAAGLQETTGYDNVKDIINQVWDKVIPQDWEIFDEEYKPVLCKKILKHYYTREIGFETVGLWKLKLETKLNEIMPYYNELYKTKLFEYNPFRDVDYFVEHEGKNEGEANENTTGQRAATNSATRNLTRNDNNSNTYQKAGNTTTTDQEAVTSNSNKWDKYNDTPQGPLDWEDGQGQWHNPVETFEYLTNARNVTDENAANRSANGNKQGNESGNSQDARTISEIDTNSENVNDSTNNTKDNTFSNTDEYVRHVYGKQGNKTYMSLVKELREIIINIDLMIIDDLKDLFMLLWR